MQLIIINAEVRQNKTEGTMRDQAMWVVTDDGSQFALCSWYSDTMMLAPEEFLGLTCDEGIALFRIRQNNAEYRLAQSRIPL